MDRDIHDIYDVILKIIAMVYESAFLEFIGIEEKIIHVLDVEFTTITGDKFYLDYLCLLESDTLCHIEFQFPSSKPSDLDRFFNYNILAQVRYQKITETYLVNFTKRKNQKIRKIGNSKSFHPKEIYLGELEFEELFEKINIKVKSNHKLSNDEEIMLMIVCLSPECKNKLKTLKQISKFLQKEDLFDDKKIEFIKAVIGLEINNFLTKEEKNEIKKEIIMTPQAEKIVLQAINEVNQKVLSETKIQSRNEGIEKGKAEVAKNLIGKMSLEEISQCTGLTIKQIEQL